MSEVGESATVARPKSAAKKYLTVLVTEVTFASGIKLYAVDDKGAESEVPPSGKPHWSLGAKDRYPAVYVRQGGSGETHDLKVKVKWKQKDHDGSATLEGVSDDGEIKIEGTFSISGEKGEAEVSAKLTKKPSVVKNYGGGRGGPGARMKWTVKASGKTVRATGGDVLRLFFVDQKPKPISGAYWTYPKHYLRVVDWATQWASGTSGGTAVFNALWDKFSNGTGARVPHATGLSYWKTNNPVQDLKSVIKPGKEAVRQGWSCRAIAHLFMEMLAVNGISCVEVIPYTDPATQMFLVKNWNQRPTPIPNWPSQPDWYYGGNWLPSSRPPLSKKGKTPKGLEVDFKKVPGVPAQGQQQAPLGFSNHWIVHVNGKLWDTSYGAESPNDIALYAKGGLAGWLLGLLPEGWVCQDLSLHNLQRSNGASN